jgi:hypothetical protein
MLAVVSTATVFLVEVEAIFSLHEAPTRPFRLDSARLFSDHDHEHEI